MTTTALTPQLEILLTYLATGRTLTNLIAIAHLGIGSLSSRIAELRGRGHVIEDEWRDDTHNRRYKAYWIKQPKAAVNVGKFD